MRDKWESSSVRTCNYTFFLLFVLVLLLVIASFPIVAAQEAEKSYFEFEFDRNYEDMNVGPSDSKRVTFKGKIKYITQIPQARQVAIRLKANVIHDPASTASKGNWLASITPPILYMNSLQREEDITVQVLGYPFENKDVTYDIVLSGTWQANPGGSGVIDPFTLTSTSTQYFQIRVTSLDSFTTGYPGERRPFTLNVKNDGNGPDAFNIDFDKPIQESLISIGFVFIYNTKRTEMIGANQIANYTFEVIGPKKFVAWQTRITEVALIVSSDAATKSGGSEVIKYSVFFQEKGTHYDIEPCLGAMALIMILLPFTFFFSKRYFLRRRRKRTSSGKG